MTNAVAFIFMCLFALHISSLGRCLFKLFAHFENWAFDFLIEFWKFSLSVAYLSILLIVSFKEQKL